MSVEDEVRAVATAWDEVVVGNDAELVGSFMTEDWVYVGPSGAATKSDIVGWIASGQLAHHTMNVVSADRIAQVGDTVVLTARKTSTGTWGGTPYAANEWITQVYVRVDGDWRCAFSQKTDAAS